MTPDAVHSHHHGLINDRYAAFKAISRKASDRHRRREAYKAAVWTVTGHLRSHHIGHQRLDPTVSLEALIHLHEAMHDNDTEGASR